MENTRTIRRQARVLRLLSHLQSGVGLNAEELADRTGVCRRTVYRDLNLMRDAGLDVYFDDDNDCYRLSSESEFIVLPSFTTDDLTTLLAAVELSILASLPNVSESLRKSTSKILSRSPRPVRHSVARLVRSFSVQSPIPLYPSQAIQVLHLVFQAIQRRRTILATFSDSPDDCPQQTTFSPYRVIVSSERWNVMGQSTRHCGIHTLDPCHVRTAELTDEIYAIPQQYQVEW